MRDRQREERGDGDCVEDDFTAEDNSIPEEDEEEGEYEGQYLATFGLEEADITQIYIRVDILDNGIGISKEERATLFQPFKQAQRLAGGTGLGLYSLARRLDALKGFYGVSKRPDGAPGSQFWFALPYLPDATYVPKELTPQTSAHNSRHTSMIDGQSVGDLAV